MDLVEAFRAEDAAVAVVGAGGKKTTLYALADRLDRAVVTASVRIPIFDGHVARVAVADDPVAVLRSADGEEFPLGLVPERERDDRYLGYDTERVDELIAAHDGATLIKADGARTRSFKAPKEGEPRIPDAADVVVPVVAVEVVGEPLTEALVHRPERVAAVADCEVGDEITPETVAAVLASDDGGLKGVPEGATVVPLLNKVDDAAAESVAREVAAAVHDRLDARRAAGDDVPPVPHVVLGRLIDGTVVATVES